MAEIEILPLADHLTDDERELLVDALDRLGAARLPASDHAAATVIAESIDDAALAALHGRLGPPACDVYLPVALDDGFVLGARRIGSAPSLVEALEAIRGALPMALQATWDALYDGALAAIDAGLALVVHRA